MLFLCMSKSKHAEELASFKSLCIELHCISNLKTDGIAVVHVFRRLKLKNKNIRRNTNGPSSWPDTTLVSQTEVFQSKLKSTRRIKNSDSYHGVGWMRICLLQEIDDASRY